MKSHLNGPAHSRPRGYAELCSVHGTRSIGTAVRLICRCLTNQRTLPFSRATPIRINFVWDPTPPRATLSLDQPRILVHRPGITLAGPGDTLVAMERKRKKRSRPQLTRHKAKEANKTTTDLPSRELGTKWTDGHSLTELSVTGGRGAEISTYAVHALARPPRRPAGRTRDGGVVGAQAAAATPPHAYRPPRPPPRPGAAMRGCRAG